MTDPKYRTAFITGGTTGIGAAMARALAKRGTKVAICGRRQDVLDSMLLELGDRGCGVCSDVADPKKAAAAVDQAREKLGSLDLVIANAGTGRNRHATRLKPEDVLHVLELNVIGTFATITAAIPHMLEQKRGHLAGVSSIAGYRGLPTSAAYSASKAALSVFLESLRVDLYQSGIKVTDVRPGFVDTPLTQSNNFKMPFLVPAEVAGEKIVRALEKEKRVFTFPFPMLIGAQLLTMIPRWLYDRLGGGVRIEKG